MAKRKDTAPKTTEVDALRHQEDRRVNIPTAEHRAVMPEEEQQPLRLRYHRNPDLDPQLVWRGKDEQDGRDLEVDAPPLYIQEKVHPKVLIDDLMAASREREKSHVGEQIDLFADFNGLQEGAEKTEFYRHDQNWTNRMILGDSLQVMASLAEREGLRGQVQCIYFDPPYGIKFNSNFQWSTTSRDVKDGKAEHITREPEQVKAFRDTWRDGIHSYLSYLRDRLTVARDLLTESGSIFVQIGDENVHRVRAVMDEVFGDSNCIAQIPFIKTSGKGGVGLDSVNDYLVWYSKNKDALKYRQLYNLRSQKSLDQGYTWVELPNGARWRLSTSELRSEDGEIEGERFITAPLNSQSGGENSRFRVPIEGKSYTPTVGFWKTSESGMLRLMLANRLIAVGKTLSYVRYANDFPVVQITNWWNDTQQSTFATQKHYVVETYSKVIERCLLMATDPGDLVLDPTCGSGTTAYVAEQWGRRWITIDTSRVALALARARIMGARYPFYLLADTPDGQRKEAEVSQSVPSSAPTYGNIKHGFVYERVPHITLKSIANNTEIDVIWERYEESLAPLRARLSESIPARWLSDYRAKQKYTDEVPAEIQEWEVPREFPEAWPETARELHARFWEERIARQKEIDTSIAARADYEYLYDKPYEDKKRIRVAGPFTVESIHPHRVIGPGDSEDANGMAEEDEMPYGQTFTELILENLRHAGVQQGDKKDRITFTSGPVPWPGRLVAAEGRYLEGDLERRAAIFIGPEFGTVTRPDLVEAAKEAAESGFDVLIACAFNFEAQTTEFNKMGRIPVLKARMNADLHMASDLKSTGKGNLFVVFGEPDIRLEDAGDGHYQVRVAGVDVFDPRTGEIRSDDTDGIACWMLDTNYNEESFFVRHAYFLGANDPYTSLKRSLRAEIDEEAWSSLHSDVSRPFPRPATGRIAVKVINHLGDEVMRVMKVNE